MGISNQSSRIPVYELPRRLRPTLYFTENYYMPVRKAGIIPFLRKDGIIYVLLQCKQESGLFESFSGSVDYDDVDLKETAAREGSEESNNVLDYADIVEEISDDFCHYHHSGKSCFYFVEIQPIHPCVFGDREIHDNIPRTCHWIKLDTVRFYSLHPGMKNSTWDSTLKELLA